MYKNILAAIDNSELSKQAFEQALSLAKAFNANLHLLHVISSLQAEYEDTASLAFSGAYYPDTIDEIVKETWENLEEAGLELLKSLCSKATEEGIFAEFTLKIGEIDQTIVEFTKNHNADLVVVGSHSRKGLSEFFFGSVSNYVSHNVNCSVLLVH